MPIVANFDPEAQAQQNGSTVEFQIASHRDGRGCQRLIAGWVECHDPWERGWKYFHAKDRLVAPGGAVSCVKAITNVLHLEPPSGYGSKRYYVRDDWEDWIYSLDSFVFCDALKYPRMPIWLVPRRVVVSWIGRPHSPFYITRVTFPERNGKPGRAIYGPKLSAKRKEIFPLLRRFDPPRPEDEWCYAVDVPVQNPEPAPEFLD